MVSNKLNSPLKTVAITGGSLLILLFTFLAVQSVQHPQNTKTNASATIKQCADIKNHTDCINFGCNWHDCNSQGVTTCATNKGCFIYKDDSCTGTPDQFPEADCKSNLDCNANYTTVQCSTYSCGSQGSINTCYSNSCPQGCTTTLNNYGFSCSGTLTVYSGCSPKVIKYACGGNSLDNDDGFCDGPNKICNAFSTACLGDPAYQYNCNSLGTKYSAVKCPSGTDCPSDIANNCIKTD